MLALLAIRVDLSKYVVRVSPAKGVVTLRWRWGERDDHNEKFVEIASLLALDPSSRAFNYSCSGKLSAHKPEDIANNCVQWYHWHRCWLYGNPPEVHLPPSMPIPRHVATAVLCSRLVDDVAESSNANRVPPRPRDIFAEVFEETVHNQPSVESEEEDENESDSSVSETSDSGSGSG